MAASLALRSHAAHCWNSYNSALKANPISTKALTCASAYAVGDTIAQLSTTTTRRRSSSAFQLYDPVRTARLALFGLLWMGPTGHAFYSWMEKAILPHMPGHALNIACKVTIDQLLFTPLCTAVFFAWNNVASGTVANIQPDIATKLVPSTVAAWCLWAPASTLNMAVVPGHLRMLFINAVSLVWTNVLSRMASVDGNKEDHLAVLPALSLAPAVWQPGPGVGARRRTRASNESVASSISWARRLNVYALLDDLLSSSAGSKEAMFRFKFAMPDLTVEATMLSVESDELPDLFDLADPVSSDGEGQSELLPATFCP